MAGRLPTWFLIAEIDLTVRHADPQVAQSVWKRVVEISRGAAIATETTSEYEVTSGCYPLLINHTLIDLAAKKIQRDILTPLGQEPNEICGRDRLYSGAPGNI